MAFANTSLGDYPVDAGPAVHELVRGNLSAYLSVPAMMGAFATLLQVPFALVGRGSELTEYQWACVPCLLAVGMLGIYLASIVRQRGGSRLFQVTIAALCLVNPLSFAALETGHPEELLTAALAVGAVATAAQGYGLRAAVLLGLALASKQWAVIAIFPMLMALPAQRVRAGVIAGLVALAFVLPGMLAAPDAFSMVHSNAASTGRFVDPWNIWFAGATHNTEVLDIGSTSIVANYHEAPPLVGEFSHPLIVLLTFAVPLGLAYRRRGFDLSGSEAMALLSLLALLRCALDPVGNLYYHEPLLMALIGWDALARPGSLPLRGLLGAAIAGLLWNLSSPMPDLHVFNAIYIAIMLVAGVAIAAFLFRRSGSRSETLVFEDVSNAMSGRSVPVQ